MRGSGRAGRETPHTPTRTHTKHDRPHSIHRMHRTARNQPAPAPGIDHSRQASVVKLVRSSIHPSTHPPTADVAVGLWHKNTTTPLIIHTNTLPQLPRPISLPLPLSEESVASPAAQPLSSICRSQHSTRLIDPAAHRHRPSAPTPHTSQPHTAMATSTATRTCLSCRWPNC